MTEKSKISSLTNANIVKEYEELFKERIIKDIIKLSVFLLYYVFVAWLFSLIPWAIFLDIITFGVLVASCYFIIGYYVKEIIVLTKNRKLILNGDFNVTTEKIVNTFPKERYNKFLVLGLFINPVLAFYIIEHKPYRLVFSGFGEYKILNGKYYTSSDIYEMTEKGVYNRAATGDLHYLVVCGKNIALVYNTKMFEYKEN